MYWNLKLTAYDTANNNEVIFSGEATHEPKDILEEYMIRDFLKVTEKELIEKYKFKKMSKDSIIKIKAEWSAWTDNDKYIGENYNYGNYYYRFTKKHELKRLIRKAI